MKNAKSKIYPPTVVALDVTYNCNLRCLHCFNSSGETNRVNRKELSDEELLNVADSIIELKPRAVCLCGGEPILRGKIIYDLIEKITKGTNNETEVNMVTNGQAITREVAKKLKKSGLYNIQVSLDGPDAECCDWIRNKQGAFDKAIQAIKFLVEEDLHVGVSCCPTKKNYKKFGQTIELAISLGVKTFRVQPLMNLGRAKQYLSEYTLNFIEYKTVVDALEKNRRKYTNISIDWGDPINHLVVIASESDLFEPTLVINAYGDLSLSPYIPISFGNVRKNKASDYWKKGLYSAYRAKFYKEVCGKITTANNMDLSAIIDGVPQNYIEKTIEIDIIDNPQFDKLSFEDLMKSYS